MPIGENAGGIYVTIDGDNSPLVAKLEKTQAVAKQAGTAIAESFNSAAVSAQDLGFAAGSIVGAIERLTNVVREESAAASLAEQRNISLAASFAGLGRAANSATGALGGSINSARVLGSELRVVEGSGGILAAERFLTMIPGAVAAANFALPLIGLAAVVELVGRGIEKFTGLSEAEKKAQENMVQLTKDTKSLNEEIAKIDTDTFKKLFGETATAGAHDIPNLEGKIAAQKALIASTKAMQDAQIKAKKDFDDMQAAVLQSGGGFLGPGPTVDKDLPATITKQETELDKMQAQLHAANVDMNQSQQADVKKGNEEAKRLADEKAEDEARVHEEFIVAQEDFDRRTAEENRKAEEEARKHAEAMKAARDLQIRELADDGRLMDEQIRRNQESARSESEAQQRQATLAQRTGQIGIEKSGVGAESQNETDKLKAQQQYASQLVHTKAQEIAYAEQMAAFDEKALQIKISVAQMELSKAIAEQNLVPTRENELKIEEDRLKIAQAKAALRKQETEDETKLAGLKQKESLAGQIIGKVGTGPGSLVDAANIQIANTTATAIDGISAALGRAAQGGQSLSKIMQQLGKSILGEIVSGIVKIGLQMAVTAAIGKSATAAMAATEAAEAAGLGAAWAFVSVLAALPFPINVATAPGVAAAEAAQILAIGVPKFDKGGPINEDQLAMVHKGEYVLTADQVSGRTDIPSFGGGGIGSTPFTNTMSVNSASSAFSIGAIHLHGVRDMQDVARRLPNVLKAASSSFQPASR